MESYIFCTVARVSREEAWVPYDPIPYLLQWLYIFGRDPVQIDRRDTLKCTILRIPPAIQGAWRGLTLDQVLHRPFRRRDIKIRLHLCTFYSHCHSA